MGLQIGEIIPKREITFDQLRGKVIAVDAFNTIYQFLTTIRQPDGTPLMDKKGRITSHLSGLFYRTTHLMKLNLKPIYVFDGKPPKLKYLEATKREKVKTEARALFEEAKVAGKEEEMGKFAKRTATLTQDMIDESKKLLSALGLPVVQAPSEGEAQAAFMARRKEIWAAASQDYDSLLFGTPRLVQNLTLARKRRLPSGMFVQITPKLILLKEVYDNLKINKEQLLSLAILCGTDFNPGGVKGIGPKTALDLVRKNKTPAAIFRAASEKGKGEIWFDWREVFELFKKPAVTKKYSIKFKVPNESAIKKLLVKEHDFSAERIDSALLKIAEAKKKASQTGLKKWF